MRNLRGRLPDTKKPNSRGPLTCLDQEGAGHGPTAAQCGGQRPRPHIAADDARGQDVKGRREGRTAERSVTRQVRAKFPPRKNCDGRWIVLRCKIQYFSRASPASYCPKNIGSIRISLWVMNTGQRRQAHITAASPRAAARGNRPVRHIRRPRVRREDEALRVVDQTRAEHVMPGEPDDAGAGLQRGSQRVVSDYTRLGGVGDRMGRPAGSKHIGAEDDGASGLDSIFFSHQSSVVSPQKYWIFLHATLHSTLALLGEAIRCADMSGRDHHTLTDIMRLLGGRSAGA